MTVNTIFNSLILASFILLALAFCFSFWRALMGPRITHRVVALDLMANIVIGVAASYAMWRHQTLYLSLIIGLALIIFLGTVAYAQYIESRIKGHETYD